MFNTKAKQWLEHYKSIFEVHDEEVFGLLSAFKEGCDYGYNYANEWHYVKDGLPKMSTEFIYCSDDLIFLTKDCSGNILKHFGYFNSRKRFEEYNTGYEFISDKVVAWKEIVPLELPKESE